jgi:hypothetical protein
VSMRLPGNVPVDVQLACVSHSPLRSFSKCRYLQLQRLTESKGGQQRQPQEAAAEIGLRRAMGAVLSLQRYALPGGERRFVSVVISVGCADANRETFACAVSWRWVS